MAISLVLLKVPFQIPLFRALALAGALGVASLLGACGTGKPKADPSFFTSGSAEADQRAEQRMAKSNQLQGSQKKANGTSETVKQTLYERLGAADGLTAVVADFVPRAIADPRVNWTRSGVTHGGFMGMRAQSSAWDPNAGNLALLKQHMVQFLSVATGGPTKYTGKEMKSAHAGMRITNTEFDAAVGDFKASLDKLQVATAEQKELLAILESTRPQIVEVR